MASTYKKSLYFIGIFLYAAHAYAFLPTFVSPETPSGLVGDAAGNISMAGNYLYDTTQALTLGDELCSSAHSLGAGDTIICGKFELKDVGYFAKHVEFGDEGIRPACDSSHRGWQWYDLNGSGVADTGAVCLKNASDGYSWVIIGSVGGGGGDAFVSDSLAQFAATTSAQLAGVITNETGSNLLVFSDGATLSSPTLVTPALGVATATSINKVAITAPATSATLTIANGKTLTSSNTLTLAGTDGSSVAFGAGGTVAYTANKISDLAAVTSAELFSKVSDEVGNGSGFVLRATSSEYANWNTAYDSMIQAATSPLTLSSGTLSIGYDNQNLIVSSGNLTTSQDLRTTANPTFAGATVDGLTIGIAAANKIRTSSSDLILQPADGQKLELITATSGHATSFKLSQSTANADSFLTFSGGARNISLGWNATNDEVQLSISSALGTGNVFAVTPDTKAINFLGDITVADLKTIDGVDVGVVVPDHETRIDDLEATVAFGAASSTSGNIPSFSDAAGKTLADSGIASANIGLKTGALSQFATTTSAQVASVVSNETGSNLLVFSDGATLSSPTLVTPALGVATATSINKVAITAPATSATLSIADGATLSATASVALNQNLRTTDSPSFASVTATTLAGTLSTAAQPNVTTMSGLNSIQGQTVTLSGALNVSGGAGTLDQSVATGAAPAFSNPALTSYTLADAGTKPTCNSGIVGRVFRDAGSVDTVEICVQTSATPTYAWVSQLGGSSSYTAGNGLSLFGRDFCL